jgi:hypothetical protein
MWSVRNRVLDSDAGNWLTRDPLGFVDGGNLYEYVAGNPASWIDPMGMLAQTVGDTSGSVDLGNGYAPLPGGGVADGLGPFTLPQPWQPGDPLPPPPPNGDGPQLRNGAGPYVPLPDDGWWNRRPKNPQGGGLDAHLALDGLGMCPVFGNVFDLINAGYYLVEGDVGNAAISGLGALPGGQAVTGGRMLARVGGEVVVVVAATSKGLGRASDGARAFAKGAGKGGGAGAISSGATKGKFGKSKQFGKPGGEGAAYKDFENAVEPGSITDHGGGMFSGTLPGGGTASVRPGGGANACATVQVNPASGKAEKYRYSD